MTNANSGAGAAVEPNECAPDKQAVVDEPIPPIISDWTPEVDEYRSSTA
ncbi:hypothetical protein [Streptomyces sp. NPDC005760]